MPKDPILPTIDWKSVWESGITFEEWMQSGEHPAHREQIRKSLAENRLPAHIKAYMSGLGRPVYVVAIAEDWCGDVARHVPTLESLAAAGPNLKVRYITRLQYPDLFARYLTNGGEAIPKFIFLSDKFVECGNWGPMPAVCRERIARGKACGDTRTARQQVAKFYYSDPQGLLVIRELMELIDIAATESL